MSPGLRFIIAVISGIAGVLSFQSLFTFPAIFIPDALIAVAFTFFIIAIIDALGNLFDWSDRQRRKPLMFFMVVMVIAVVITNIWCIAGLDEDGTSPFFSILFLFTLFPQELMSLIIFAARHHSLEE